MCGARRKSALSGMSHLQYKKRSVLYIEGRVISAVQAESCAVPEGSHLQDEKKVV